MYVACPYKKIILPASACSMYIEWAKHEAKHNIGTYTPFIT